MNLIWSDNSGRLNGVEASVLLKMADHAADDGSSIFPSLSTLCKTTKFSKSAVTRAIKTLVNKGFLTVVRPGKAKHKTTLYKIDVDVLENQNKTAPQVKVIHKKSVYKTNCILRGYSHCILRGYSHCTLRESPSPIITTINNPQLFVGASKSVDKSPSQGHLAKPPMLERMDFQNSQEGDIAKAVEAFKNFTPTPGGFKDWLQQDQRLAA